MFLAKTLRGPKTSEPEHVHDRRFLVAPKYFLTLGIETTVYGVRIRCNALFMTLTRTRYYGKNKASETMYQRKHMSLT
jgi:hypothetical protein